MATMETGDVFKSFGVHKVLSLKVRLVQIDALRKQLLRRELITIRKDHFHSVISTWRVVFHGNYTKLFVSVVFVCL